MSARPEQAAILRVCFDATPRDEDLETLGHRARWTLYREMVRRRFLGLLRGALPRTCETLGEARLDALFTAWLAESPPDTRYFWRLPLRFAAWAALEADTVEADLLALEAARWRVRHAEPIPLPASDALDFEAVPVWNPNAIRLEVSHRVHQRELDAPPREPWTLVVYRREDLRAGTYAVGPFTGAMLAFVQAGDRPLSAAFRDAAASLGREMTQGDVEKASAHLASLMERGVILGSVSKA